MTDTTFDRTRPPRHGAVRVLVGVQLYTVAAYLAAAIVPYLWRRYPAPPTWLWIVPGWLLGVPGYFITGLGARLAIPLALLGAGVVVLPRGGLPAGLYRWCIAATLLTAAYGAFTLTPLGHAIGIWVAD